MQQIPYAKTRGREDNLMYKISEGYNLESNDKTFWDVNNIYDILMQRKKASSPNSSIWSDHGKKNHANKSALAILESVKSNAEQPVFDHADIPQFGVYSDFSQTPGKARSPPPYQSGTPSSTLLQSLVDQDTASMTLEEKILNGVYK